VEDFYSPSCIPESELKKLETLIGTDRKSSSKSLLLKAKNLERDSLARQEMIYSSQTTQEKKL
jgi:hypothetical protein